LTGVVIMILCASIYFFLRTEGMSDFSSAIGTLTFGTFPLILDEVGWGGQAQFLAMTFGVIALVFVVRFKERPSLRRNLVSGLLLTLSILTDPYAALYFIVMTVFLWLLEYRKSLLNRNNLINGLIRFAPAAIAIIAVQVVQRISYSAESLAPMAFDLTYYNPYLLLIRLTNGHFIIIATFLG